MGKLEEIKKKPQKETKWLSSVEAMMSAKQFNQASTLIKQKVSQGLNKDIANYLLARLALADSKVKDWRIYAAQLSDSPLFANFQIVSEIYLALPKDEQQWLVKSLMGGSLLKKAPPSVCPFYELNQRSLRGQFLGELVKNFPLDSKVSDNLFSELYLHMPETLDVERYASDKFLSWQKKLSAADFVERMNNLMLFGKNREARTTFEQASILLPNSNDDEKCELRYQNAKVERKMRNYKNARAEFQALAETCGPDVKQKARYMDLMLASMAGDVGARPQFDLFVADYPTHGFSDDVLFFAASMERGAGNYEAMFATLDDLIKKFPEGDMIHQALFLKAFELAKMAKVAEALPLLSTLKEKSLKDSLVYQQAHYWQNRLKVFSDLKSLALPNKANLTQLRKELSELVFSPSPTVYSWLSWQLLKELKLSAIEPKAGPTPKGESSVSKDARLVLIKQLIDVGFIKEPLALLDQMIVSSSDEATIFAMAQLFIDLQRPEMGYQKLIQCNAQLAQVLAKRPILYSAISFPKPYATEVAHATKQANVPPNLIYAIMRRESGFLSNARSWAQARGLMQMMKATADEQAKKLGLKLSSEEELFNPELNLLLGSSLIQNYWQRFGNLVVALSAYNAGPAAARSWIKKNDGAPLDSYLETISIAETSSYAKNVLGGFYSYGRKEGLSTLPTLDMYLATK